MSKVIISCAVTGAIHTPVDVGLPAHHAGSRSPSRSIAAAEAGAAIIHLHARDPNDGRPTPDPAVFMQFLPVIKQSTDAVINITTGGGLGMTLEERLAAPLQASPEMCSLNMGSMNFNISGSAARIKQVQVRLGEALPGGHHRLHLPQHLRGHRADRREARQGPRHALRVRVLRHRPPLQPGAHAGPQGGGAAAVRAVDLRHPGRASARSTAT